MTDLDRRVEELAAHQHGVFTTRQLLLQKVHPKSISHRVTTGRWQRDRRGVLRLLGAPPTTQSRFIGAVLALDRAAVISHRSAAWLHDLPGFNPEPVEVTLPRGHRSRLDDVFRIHRSNCMPDSHRTVIDDIPVSTLARVLLELTAVVPIGRVARTMDSAIGQDRVAYPELIGVLHDVQARGRRRTQIFRVLLEERQGLYVPPASELERRFKDLVGSAGMGTWDRQVDLGSSDRWIGRVDFYRRDARLIVEVDGKAAHSSFLDQKADRARQAALEAAGFKLLRFGWAEVVARPTEVLRTLRSAIATDPDFGTV